MFSQNLVIRRAYICDAGVSIADPGLKKCFSLESAEKGTENEQNEDETDEMVDHFSAHGRR
jgi:hypothetical protein